MYWDLYYILPFILIAMSVSDFGTIIYLLFFLKFNTYYPSNITR
jgi:hypothetical protein